MTPKKSNQHDDYWLAAEEAFKAAQRMSVGPERIAALKKAGQMRFDAYKRIYEIQDTIDKER